MRTLWLSLALLLIAAPSMAAEPAANPVRLLVPAYFYPGDKGMDEWKRLAKAAKDVPIIAIANPASGPGRQQDPAYVEALKLARDAGVTVIGYVSTRYAKRPLEDVRADIDTWLKLYPNVDGFFFDEQVSDQERLPYYLAAVSHARQRCQEYDCLIVTNPGTTGAVEYLRPYLGINISCVFENATAFDAYQQPVWSAVVPAAQLSALVYNEPSLRRMREHVKTAAGKGVGYLYVTDAASGNPWEQLPTYWELEVAELKRTQPLRLPPAVGTNVPNSHWGPDALNQLAQHGIFTGYPDGPGNYTSKRAVTRLQLGDLIREMLERVEAVLKQPEALAKHSAYATRQEAMWDAKALRMLSREFDHERDLFGMSRAHVGSILRDFEAAANKLPSKK